LISWIRKHKIKTLIFIFLVVGFIILLAKIGITPHFESMVPILIVVEIILLSISIGIHFIGSRRTETTATLAQLLSLPPSQVKPTLPDVIPTHPAPYFAHPYPLQENFTGRLSERKELTEWFTKGSCPMFAYVAIGGMGKSALTWY